MVQNRFYQLALTHETPSLFLSKSRILESYYALQRALPGVTLYYAVKANNTRDIIKTLHDTGSCFDVCTNAEIDLVRKENISPSQCLHTHPVKRDSDIQYALDFGIEIFVADNMNEIKKLLPYKDRLRVLIRLSIQNPTCPVNLSHKFGVAPQEAFQLIQDAAAAGIRIEGLAFHAGSQNENALKYIEALEYCRDLCRLSALAGIELKTIDIGGGFPIDYLQPTLPITQYCQQINEYLERYFNHYRIIAEPGRFICGPAGVLAAKVIGKSIRDGIVWYFIDEGMYGCFSGKVYDHADYPMRLPKGGKKIPSTIAGPTCDSTDVVYENVLLPELEIGDILLFDAMGAYTNASATTFNGYPKAPVIMVD